MCVYSMIGDHYYDKWTRPPYQVPPPAPMNPYSVPIYPYPQAPSYPLAPQMPSAAEIAEFYELLRRAKEYDLKNNEPDCGLDEKKEKLRKLAKAWGIELSFP